MIALPDTSKDPKAIAADVAAAWRTPIGAASPLWLMFAGAASAGVAFWWMNRWRSMAPTHLEAVLAPDLPVPEVAEAVEPPVVEAAEVETLVEAAPEPAIEEPAVEPVIEASAEPEAPEVEAAPKPKIPAKAKPKAADA